MQIIQDKQQCIYFDENLLTEPAEQVFDADYWQQKQKIIGSAQGRGTTWFVQLANIEGALRHYRRGGLFGKLISDSYFLTTWQKTRSIAEFQLLTELHNCGVHVPRPIAARAVKIGLTYQADLLSEKIPDAQDLVDILQTKSLSAEQYQEVGKQIKKMHSLQVNHTDLNIHNILIDKVSKVWIIDFDKCCKQTGENWKAANLARLKRSFFKEVKKRHIQWNESDWQYLVTGYQA
ncbi:3-deoxy-D-manno-octulosonic acid kinase [Psychromonas sp. Urea-02u-13]|uniref:3-deoxy-D-manno-octulosonic acid kinase n=1 Tax=Psychromonas sp. Urea-02u-13 TaxID=2058326 RepID=UPI000C342251|nr:3-deoxy-D-manno-octulosonic acid kinase [Psychromonas sp. Urea-02u-13]PKG38097.1 3-deoxy-D-manno-octulosonic acid kinase [Psychromonas sp. Urea-02u-13]